MISVWILKKKKKSFYASNPIKTNFSVNLPSKGDYSPNLSEVFFISLKQLVWGCGREQM